MKKLSVLLVAAVVAISASAGVSFKSNHTLKHNKVINLNTTKVNMKADKAKAMDLKAVVTEQPEGELKTYSRAGRYDYASSGYLYVADQPANNRVDIVYGDDNKVWLKNILCGANTYFGTDSWVEGTIEGNIINVPLGQSIAYVDSYSADILLAWGSVGINEEGYFTFIPDPDVATAQYEINGETITLLGSEGPTEAIGEDSDYMGYGLTAYWSDDDSWTGFMEWNTVLTETEPVVAPTVIYDVPETCDIKTYYRNSIALYSSLFGIGGGQTDGKFNVAFDTNGDVYVQNPMWYYDGNGAWVKGTFDEATGIITIPTGQFLSWNSTYEYGIVLGMGKTYVYEDEDENGEVGYYLGHELDERTTEIQMLVDGDNIYLLGTEGDFEAEFPENYNAYGLYTYWSDNESWTSLEFANGDAPFGYIVNLVPAVPANPTADEWYDCGDESGFSKFYFTLPTTDVDGNMLDPEYISYALWINDGYGNVYQFTFPAEDYTYDLVEDITEVDYALYSNGVDFHSNYVYMYRTNMNDNPLFVRDDTHKGNIAIEVFYTVNGVKNSCLGDNGIDGLVWLYKDGTGVNEMNADKTVANVRYFNVAGQEMAQPEGMTIKVTTYTDGTSNAVKVVK